MLTTTIDVGKEQTELKKLLSLVAEGTEVILMEGDTPVARLLPIGKRVAGLHADSMQTREDFDEPLPDDYWTGSQ